MTTIRPVELRCPACRETFETQAVMSTYIATSTTEFRPVPDTIDYAIATCPECGYTDWSERMEAGKGSHEAAEQLTEVVESWGSPSTWTLAQRYQVAARIAVSDARSKEEQAHLNLRVAWSLDDTDQAEDAAKWRRRAAELLLAALGDGELDEKDRPAASYLVGEMLRRAGDTDRATEVFDRVKSEAGDDPEAVWVAQLAGVQSTDPVDMMPE